MHHRLVVAGILRNSEGKILLTKRPATARIAPDKYHLPGGHVEEGEDLKTALARELREELGIETEIGKPVHVAWYENDGGLSIVVFFDVSMLETSGEPKPMNGELVTLQWIKGADAQRYLHPDDFNLAAIRCSESDASN